MKQQIISINQSKSTEQQLREVRNLVQLVKSDNENNENDDNEKILKMLIETYFKEQTKHPIKSSIQRFDIFHYSVFELLKHFLF